MTNKIFADTNIFIRLYLQDNPKLSPLANEIISNCEDGKYTLVICPVTILEIAWLLLSFYKIPKEKVLLFFEEILQIHNIEIIDRLSIEETISIYRSKNIDITDAYWIAIMKQEKISEIFSFDRDFDKIKGVKRTEAMT